MAALEAFIRASADFSFIFMTLARQVVTLRDYG